jgi:hypothetical protein
MVEVKERFFQLVQSFGFVATVFLISLGGVLFILISTSPLDLGPQGMLLAYGTFYLLFFTTALLCIRLWRGLRRRLQPDREVRPIPVTHRYSTGTHVMLAALFALGLLIMLALRSIGQLDIVSLLLVVAFEAIACFYILKRG